MRDDTIDERTAAFLDEVRASFSGTEAPPAGPELASLFAAGLVHDNGDLSAAAAARPSSTRRGTFMIKDLLSQLGAKAVAGALGATLAVAGLGASGTLTAPIQMIADQTGITEECAVEDQLDDGSCPDEGSGDEGSGDEGSGDEGSGDEGSGDEGSGDEGSGDEGSGDEGSGDEGSGDEGSGDEGSEELPEAPTSVSEAAHIHDFDEACGNHGAYVSYFARHGEEPACAVDARAAAEQESGEESNLSTDDTSADTASEDGESDDAKADKAERKAERKAAKAAKRGGKGKSGR